jgi:ABC-type multidrug transport system ATPase subunit
LSGNGNPATLPLLEARGLEFQYPGGFRLGPLDLRLFAGELVSLEGEPGAGKSTLLRLLAARQRPEAGTLLLRQEPLAGRRLTELAAWRRRLGLLDQDAGLPAQRSPRELLRLALAAHGLGARQRRQESMRILGETGLLARADLPCGSLSTGQGRWVQLALALCGLPELLLLDEPLAHLSPDHQVEMVASLRRLARRGMAVLFCGHGAIPGRREDVRRLRLERGRLAELPAAGGHR